MTTTIDMQDIRNLNLFQRITNIQTRFCFSYNNVLIFCVPKMMINRAVGKEGENVKRISQILRKRIRIISQPNGIEDLSKFISSIISPIEFKSVEIKEDEVILNAGSQNKAALIGRDKRRLLEMQSIIKNFFGKSFKII